MSILDQRELNKVANDKIVIEKAYDKAWTTARESTIRLPVDRFWEIMETFRCYIIDVDKHDVSKHACDELFRTCVTDNLMSAGTPVTFNELVSFIENWSAVTAALYETLSDIISDKGDSGYSNLCDSLPLIGREGVAFLLALDSTAHNDVVIRMIKRQQPAGSVMNKWLELIWEGENYWCMYLEDEAKDRYPHQAVNYTLDNETLV